MTRIFTLFAILITTQLFALNITRSIFPNEIIEGNNLVVNVTIERGEVNGFAKITEEIPAGFKYEVANEMGGTVMKEDNKFRIVWLTIPEKESFTISYRLIYDGAKPGIFNINGYFNYIENDERKSFDISKSSFKVLANKNEPEKKAANTPTSSPANPSASSTKGMNVPNTLPTAEVKENAVIDANEELKEIVKEVDEKKATEIIYKVQLGAFSKEKPKSLFQDLPDVHFEMVNNLYKYYSGNFKSEEEARKNVARAKEIGFPGAFLVKFKNGKRI